MLVFAGGYEDACCIGASEPKTTSTNSVPKTTSVLTASSNEKTADPES